MLYAFVLKGHLRMAISSNRLSAVSWQRSSFCAAGECAEVARNGDVVLLRNSAQPCRMVRYSAEEWKSFLLGAKAGEFDYLC